MADFKKIEKKWQQKWEKAKIFKTKEKGKKYYVLEMFPYPSGSGLHMGHAFNYTIGDIYARFKRMHGFNVLYPMGYDSFGLPAENAAIKAKTHPKKYTEIAINNFINQQKSLGLSYDWSRIIKTHTPEYYKWNQYFFLKFLEKDLVYRKKAAVNWCPECDTVLANEQVHEGKCWRHKETDVDIKQLEQWFIKTTEYSDELLEDVKRLKWPERIKIMQKNWLGKSEGINFKEKIKDLDIEFEVYDSVPQTFIAQTFTVIAPEHPLVLKLVKGTKYEKPVMDFVEKIKRKKLADRFDIEKETEGIFTGRYVDNPFGTGDLPIYVASYALAEYGTGIVNCSAHDERDFEFAKKYKIPLKIAMLPKDKNFAEKVKNLEICYHHAEDGIIQEPIKFKGMTWVEARKPIMDYIEKKGIGKKQTQYKLRDWLISRQRYWGTPIPIVYCDKCGIQPEKDLPVKLPEDIKFGKGNPLLANKAFINTKCPKCGKSAKRETDTMDTFFDSSWYFLRYCDPKNNKEPFNKQIAEYWMPVDQYIGGAEHACMHLIYARFFTKALRDLNLIKISEPFPKLFNQGMLHGSDGYVMSKSRGNVVNPLDMIKKYSADILRFYLISNALPSKDFIWSDKGIQGSSRLINRVVEYFSKVKINKSSKRTEHKINSAIKEVTEDINNFKYNLAVIKIRSLVESLDQEVSKDTLEKFLKILHPFCPHITEELWQNKLKRKPFISLEKWPAFDEKKIDKKIEQQEKFIEKVRSDIGMILRLVKITPKKVYLYCIPNEKQILLEEKEKLKIDFNLEFEIYAVNDKDIKDPQSKAKKAKPLKPAIYIE